MNQIKTTPADENHFHSEFGASCSDMWRTCPGAIQATRKAISEKKIPEKEPESSYAIEGTLAHDWAEKILNGEKNISDLPDNISEAVTEYVNWCRSIIKAGEKISPEEMVVNIESQVNLFYRPEDTGTMDFSVFVPDHWLQVIDYKNGGGEFHEAHEKNQLVVYGLSYIYDLEKLGYEMRDDLRVAIGIVQPNHFKYDGPSVWETTVRELKDIGIDIQSDYERANDDTILDLIPSESACRHCKIKAICTARGQTNYGGLPPACNPFTDFDDETGNIIDIEPAEQKKVIKNLDRSTFTTEQIAFIINNGSEIKKVVDDVIKGEIARISDGGELHHHKLIEGNLGHRRWSDDAAAAKLIRQKLGATESYKPRVVITAPMAIKKLETMELSTRFQNKLDSLIVRPDGSPKLVEINHKGKAIEFTKPIDDFDDETKSNDFADEDFM
ncbi:DUF2800 domain-containing protein [Akkermansiaceae bacterium]|nr:DUF2800 domain-containing protein [Akkermansiaceae bacterium]